LIVLTESEIEEFWARGFVVLRGRFAERARSLRAELERMLGSLEGMNGHQGRRFGPSGLASQHRFGGLMRASAIFADYARDPRIMDIVERLLGPASAFRDVVMSKPAGSGGTQAAHQDLAYWDIGHDRVLTTWLAMSPTRLESGALWLIPGSHRRVFEHRTVIDGRPMPRVVTRGLRALVSLTGTGDSPRDSSQRSWARLKEASLEEITRRWPTAVGLADLEILDQDLPSTERVQIEADPGDLVLFHGRIVHGSLANRLEIRRDAYLVTYVASA
jgi:ectoine hydroxylase-related dioxygenase (phytanoyl-CoA dioxygenase family)